MNEDDIKNQISDVVADSPVTTKVRASENIEAPQGKATLRAALPEQMPEEPAQQYNTTPEQGITFSKNTDEVITGGTALPGLSYDTRFKAADDGGDPLYFEPNFQPVVPFPVNDNLESDTLNARKLAWNIAVSNYGARDKDYTGYYLMPEQGSMSLWDFLIGSINTQVMSLPATLAKGVTGFVTTTAKLPALGVGALGSVISKAANELPDSDLGSIINGMRYYADATKNEADYIVNQLSLVQDLVDDAVSPMEKWAYENWDADLADNSLKAQIGRGIGSGLTTFGLAAATKNPELAFKILNFAASGEMRRNALNYGVSPQWANVYSLGGSYLNSMLDTFELEAMVNSAGLLNAGGAAVLESLGRKGILQGLKRHALREGVAFVGEMGAEVIQEGVEGLFDPEYRADPYTRSLVAAVSAFAVKATALPISIRHAQLQDQLELAKKAGVVDLYNNVFAGANKLYDKLKEDGVLNVTSRDEFLQYMMSEAPDTVIKTVREGVKGELDKIPAENRKEMQRILNNVRQNFGGKVFSPKTFAKLDSEVETNLSSIRAGLSDAEVDMIKGVVRGAYVVAAIAHSENPNYKGFTVPQFRIASNAEGKSLFSEKEGGIIWIHGSRSDTVNSNKSPEFADMVREGFIRSSSASDRMASILHEMSHWLDYVVGSHGYGDFLEHYYNNIAEVFGKDKALAVYQASEKGKQVSKRRPKLDEKDYTKEINATEYMAQAISRLGKRSAEYFGLGKSKANQFLSFANMQLNQLANLEGPNGQKLQQSIADFQTALQEITKQNMQHLEDLIEVYGSDKLQDALARFKDDAHGFDDFAEYLANEDMLHELYDVMDSFSDAAGLDKIKDLFGGDTKAMDNFVTAGDRMFRNGYDQAIAEVKQRKAEAKATKKPIEAKVDPGIVKTPAGAVNSNLSKEDLKRFLRGPELEDKDAVAERSIGTNTFILGDGTEIAYDNNDGIGATGTNRYAQEGDWKSAIITMTPDEYLALVPSMDGTPDSVPFIKDAIQNGKTIAMPFLLASGYDVEKSAPNTMIVSQHEGRHRAQVLKELGVKSMDVIVYGSALQDSKYSNGLNGVTLQYNDSDRTFTINAIKTEPYSRGQINNASGTGNRENAETGSGEMQDWALQALGAKESVKQSHDAVTEEPKKISADTEIDGRVLSDDIKLAQDGLAVRLKNKMNPIVKWAASSEWGWGLDRILVTLLGRNAAEKFDIQGKYSAKQAARSKYWGEFMDRLKPLFGNDVDKAGFVYKYKTMVTDLGLARMTNVEIIDPRNADLSTTRDITGWEAMYVYLMKRQGYGRRVQKSTTTNIDDIINLLSDEEKQFADAMSDQLMSMYERTFGKQSYTNYFPIMDLEHKLFKEMSIDSLMSRMNTDDAISIEDAGRIFSQYVSRWASHESGYFQEIKRLRDVFMYKGVDPSETGPRYKFDPDADVELIKQSASVANATINAIGQKGYDNIMNLINTQLSDGQEEIFETTRSNALNQMGNNIMKTLLANKMISFPKNLTNMFMMWGGAKDQSLYWNSFAEGFGDMSKTYNYMMAHSDEIKRRWGSAGGINEYLDQNSLGGNTAPIMKAISKAFRTMEWSADRTQNMAKFSAAMDMMGDAGLKLFMQSGDMVANVFGGYGLVKDYMAQGMTEAEAFKKLDRYIVEHQSSSNLAMKPMIQLRANKGFFSQFFAFTSEQVVKGASVLGTFDEVKMGTATKSQAIANLASIVIAATLFSALAAGAWDLWDDDEKVREEAEKAILYAAIDQALGGFVAGNSILTPAISALIGDSRMGGMRNPLYEYAMDGIAALKKEEYDRLIVKAMSALGVFVGADNAWNSMLGLSLLTDPDPRVREAGVLMTLGYTPARAKKRTGVDTRKEILEKNDEE